MMRRSSWLYKVRLPSQYRNLPDPATGNKKPSHWGRLDTMSSAEKDQLLRAGSEGEAASDFSEVVVKMDVQSCPDLRYAREATMTFRSEEEFKKLEKQLEKEASDVWKQVEDRLQPTAPASVHLAAANEFHTDTQQAVDDELSPGSTAEAMTEEERQEQREKYQTDVMAAFYVHQGLIPPHEQHAFAEWLTTSPSLMVQVHPGLPLTRLLTQSQLNSSKRFLPLNRDGFYLLPPTEGGEGANNAESTTGRGEGAAVSVNTLYWLQRNVASSAVVLADWASLVLPCLVDVLLADTTSTSAAAPLVMCPCGTNTDFDLLAADIDAYFTWKAAAVDGGAVRPSFWVRHFTERALSGEGGNANDAEMVTAVHQVLPATCGLAPTAHRSLGDVVLVAPATTSDGKRCVPEILAVDDIAKPNCFTFSDRLLTVPQRYQQLRKWLDAGIDLASPNGYIVYCTASLNPLENEAVVAGCLAERGDEVHPVSLSEEFRTEWGLPMGGGPSDGGRTVQQLFTTGLNDWANVETGSSEMEASFVTKEARDVVANAALRVAPGSDCDGGFVLVLQKGKKTTEPPGGGAAPEKIRTAAVAPTSFYVPSSSAPSLQGIPNPSLWRRGFTEGLVNSGGSTTTGSRTYLCAEQGGTDDNGVLSIVATSLSPQSRANVITADVDSLQTQVGVEVFTWMPSTDIGIDTESGYLEPSLHTPKLTAEVAESLGFPLLHLQPAPFRTLLLDGELALQRGGPPSSSSYLGISDEGLASLVKVAEQLSTLQSKKRSTSSSVLSGHYTRVNTFCFPVSLSVELPSPEMLSALHVSLQNELSLFRVPALASFELASGGGDVTTNSRGRVSKLVVRVPNAAAQPAVVACADALSFLDTRVLAVMPTTEGNA